MNTIKFTYSGKDREAVLLEDKRPILLCYQVDPEEGYRSFNMDKMSEMSFGDRDVTLPETSVALELKV